MIKAYEISAPNSCLNKAKDDELIFVLLERDAAAPEAIRFWITKRIELGLNSPYDSKLLEAEECASRMEKLKVKG